ncbi:MAG: DNA polymerase IV [Victivallaceae bacterium]|nr:DNA polymerase IV [Victivallaceae bacterium]
MNHSHLNRGIIHIDMDAFFASVEQRDHPELRGKPVLVGGSVASRGVVSTCSYEARVFGIHSGMPMARALRLCPSGVFVEVNFRKYSEASRKIMKIFHSITDLVEPMSIDEAFLDVTENHLAQPDYAAVAREIKERIYAETELTASAGVSYNKFLAKVASGWQKPNGLTVITPEEAESFLERLPIEKFFGIGKVTAEKLHRMNVRTGIDLKALSPELLTAHFGKSGVFYHQIVRGIDTRPVETVWERRSYGRETTFPRDTGDLRKLRVTLRILACNVSRQLEHSKLNCRTVTIKLRYDDFQTVTRSASFPKPLATGADLGAAAVALLRKTEAGQRKVRLIGVSVSNLAGADVVEQCEAQQLYFDFIPEKFRK